jgi:hypothetical protein
LESVEPSRSTFLNLHGSRYRHRRLAGRAPISSADAVTGPRLFQRAVSSATASFTA